MTKNFLSRNAVRVVRPMKAALHLLTRNPIGQRSRLILRSGTHIALTRLSRYNDRKPTIATAHRFVCKHERGRIVLEQCLPLTMRPICSTRYQIPASTRWKTWMTTICVSKVVSFSEYRGSSGLDHGFGLPCRMADWTCSFCQTCQL